MSKREVGNHNNQSYFDVLNPVDSGTESSQQSGHDFVIQVLAGVLAVLLLLVVVILTQIILLLVTKRVTS